MKPLRMKVLGGLFLFCCCAKAALGEILGRFLLRFEVCSGKDRKKRAAAVRSAERVSVGDIRLAEKIINAHIIKLCKRHEKLCC